MPTTRKDVKIIKLSVRKNEIETDNSEESAKQKTLRLLYWNSRLFNPYCNTKAVIRITSYVDYRDGIYTPVCILRIPTVSALVTANTTRAVSDNLWVLGRVFDSPSINQEVAITIRDSCNDLEPKLACLMGHHIFQDISIEFNRRSILRTFDEDADLEVFEWIQSSRTLLTSVGCKSQIGSVIGKSFDIGGVAEFEEFARRILSQRNSTDR